MITTILFDAGGTLVYVDYRFLQKELRKVGITVTRQQVREAEGTAKAVIDRRMEAVTPDTDDTRRQPYFAALLQQLGIKTSIAAQLLHTIETTHQPTFNYCGCPACTFRLDQTQPHCCINLKVLHVQPSSRTGQTRQP